MRYGGLIVVMLLSFLLVTAEFLPNGVLTEMALSLGVTPGQAGQTVTVTALAGLLVAPTVGLLLPRLDRRTLLMGAAAAEVGPGVIHVGVDQGVSGVLYLGAAPGGRVAGEQSRVGLESKRPAPPYGGMPRLMGLVRQLIEGSRTATPFAASNPCNRDRVRTC
jgi:MFS family permease